MCFKIGHLVKHWEAILKRELVVYQLIRTDLVLYKNVEGIDKEGDGCLCTGFRAFSTATLWQQSIVFLSITPRKERQLRAKSPYIHTLANYHKTLLELAS